MNHRNNSNKLIKFKHLQKLFGKLLQTTLAKIRPKSNHRRNDAPRVFGFDTFEPRTVLSAVGLDVNPEQLISNEAMEVTTFLTDPVEIQAENELGTGIASLTLQVNDEFVNVVYPNQIVELSAGDFVRVAAVNYEVDGTLDGVLASEGYASKLGVDDLPSSLDYSDGRFSAQVDDQSAATGSGSLHGLVGGWKVQEGWDRLTINLMNYSSTGSSSVGRFQVMLQVGKPDFEVDASPIAELASQKLLVGQSIDLKAALVNSGQGRFHDYLEVDVYQADDLNTIVWAGALVGNVDGSHSVTGMVTNQNQNDSFAETWTPDKAGEYVLRIYADPEDAWSELNEDNNEAVVHLTVLESTPMPSTPGDLGAPDTFNPETPNSEPSQVIAIKFVDEVADSTDTVVSDDSVTLAVPPTSDAVVLESNDDEIATLDDGLVLIDSIKATSSIANAIEFTGDDTQPAQESLTEVSTPVEVVLLDTTPTAPTAPTTPDALLSVTSNPTSQENGLPGTPESITSQLENSTQADESPDQPIPETVADSETQSIANVPSSSNPLLNNTHDSSTKDSTSHVVEVNSPNWNFGGHDFDATATFDSLINKLRSKIRK